MVDVELDGGERLRLHERRLLDGLAVGTTVDGHRLEDLRTAERIDGAEQRALALLGARARSRAELDGALERRGLSSPEREEVLTRLTDLDLVDDRALASRVAEAARERGEGRMLVQACMRRFGIADAQRPPEPGQADEAERAAHVLAGRYGDPPYEAAVVRRAQALLLRRGFDEETVTAVLEPHLPG
jgi:regulatory protein